MRVDGVQCTIELLETVFRVAEIFSDSCYSIYFLCVFFLFWLTSYYVILAFCVLCAVLWVGGVDVYNVDSPLFVCACFVDTPATTQILLQSH